MLPIVSMVAWAVAGAVQRYQIEDPPGKPAWLGSPASLVAKALLALSEPSPPEMTWPLAKASLAGPVPELQPRATEPVAPRYPSTAMRYSVPAVTARVTALVVPSASSLLATRLSAETLEPV